MKEFNLLQPYVVLAESLGRFQAQLVDKAVSEVRIEYAGDVVDVDAAPVTRAFLAGLLRDVSARVNVVNAFLIADERGIKVTTTYIRSGGELAPAMRTEIRAGDSTQSLAGTLFGYGGQQRGAAPRSTDFISKLRQKVTCWLHAITTFRVSLAVLAQSWARAT